MGDTPECIYQGGYLPYSGPDAQAGTLFYMARSARISLAHFSLSSENRRIVKKFDGLLLREVVPLKQFNWKDKTFLSFCTGYFTARFGQKIMPEKRLLSILGSGLVTHIIVYSWKESGCLAGYVLLVSDGASAHFWYSFYDTAHIKKSLGMWLMIDTARFAHEKGKKHLYVGTVYGDKARYKTNFNRLEYWDGSKWVSDVKMLRELAKKDGARVFDNTR